MPTSLVTGGAGFIGSHVVDELVRRHHHVVAVDDLSGGFRSNVAAGVEFVEGSILDNGLVSGLFQEKRFDYVFHLAAYAAEGLSHFIKRFNYSNNLIGSVNLINASVNLGSVKRFVFTSSIAVYGRNQLPMTEAMVPMPEDPYGIAKYAVELDLREAQAMFGLDFTVFRPHNVYGERQNVGDRYRNVIGIFMNQILRGEPLTIFGDGLQSRAFTYISDVAPILASCLDRPESCNQIFNVGADVPIRVADLARDVMDAMDARVDIRHLPPRHEVEHAFCSHERVRSVFGDIIKGIPLKEGLARMADWVKWQGAKQGESFKEIEVTRNLPPSWRQS